MVSVMDAIRKTGNGINMNFLSSIADRIADYVCPTMTFIPSEEVARAVIDSIKPEAQCPVIPRSQSNHSASQELSSTVPPEPRITVITPPAFLPYQKQIIERWKREASQIPLQFHSDVPTPNVSQSLFFPEQQLFTQRILRTPQIEELPDHQAEVQTTTPQEEKSEGFFQKLIEGVRAFISSIFKLKSFF